MYARHTSAVVGGQCRVARKSSRKQASAKSPLRESEQVPHVSLKTGASDWKIGGAQLADSVAV